MKASVTLFLAAASAASVITGASARRHLQDTPEVGVIGDVSPIGENVTDTTDESTLIEDELVADLETDEQVSVVGGVVQLGGLDCDSLTAAEDAASLQFTIVNNEVIIAAQSSYETDDVDGTSFKIWAGEVTDPVQSDTEVEPRTVSLTWSDDCSVETFLLKVTSRNTDGSTTVVKSIPCEAGSETDICFVELLIEFEEPVDEPVAPPSVDAGAGRLLRNAPRASAERRLQSTTQVDVMVLYTGNALQSLGTVTAQQMKTYIITAIFWTNLAFFLSDIDLFFNLVHVDVAPFVEESDVVTALGQLGSDADVADMRDTYEADLVQLIGDFDTFCGAGYAYNGLPNSGFSVVKANCFDGYAHSLFFGYNMGCNLDRTSTTANTEYSHGFRYCTDTDQYRTLMTTAFSCGTSPIALFYSNPDITYKNKPTGTETEDNARTIRENMETISLYKPDAVAPAPTPNSEYDFVDCYIDDKNDRVLTGESFFNDPTMTTEVCAENCVGSTYFGTEYGRECFCGPATDDPSANGLGTCNFDCAGDPDQTCGGNNAISVYMYNDSPYTSVGCYQDDPVRVMTGDFEKGNNAMTTEVCAVFCDGSPYFGTQYGNECYCAADGDDPTQLGPATCDIACAGDDTETCGGNYALSLYTYEGVLVERATPLGCYNDDKNDRIMTLHSSSDDMTNEMCEGLCDGSAYFGTQYSVECWCGDDSTFDRHGTSSSCNFPCGGDDDQTCGGFTVVNVWEY